MSQISLLALWWLSITIFLRQNWIFTNIIHYVTYIKSNSWFQGIYGIFGGFLAKNGPIQCIYRPLWGSPMNLYSGNGHTMRKKSFWRAFVMVNSHIRAKTSKNSIVENPNFFRHNFKGVSSTFPDELRVLRRAPEPKFSYAIKKLTFRTDYTP